MGTRGNFETSDPSTFVGRAAELAELHAALDDAAAGRGRLFLISGEPGIGKTRLADEFSSVATALGAAATFTQFFPRSHLESSRPTPPARKIRNSGKLATIPATCAQFE
jgi:hypothetical protein